MKQHVLPMLSFCRRVRGRGFYVVLGIKVFIFYYLFFFTAEVLPYSVIVFLNQVEKKKSTSCSCEVFICALTMRSAAVRETSALTYHLPFQHTEDNHYLQEQETFTAELVTL